MVKSVLMGEVEGLEIDAVVELKNGDFGAIEIKLSQDRIEEGVANLQAFSKELTVEPKFKAVMCGPYPAVVRRGDGVYILPLTAMRG